MMYAAVTMNLLKKLASVTEDAAPPPIQVKLPDFSQVQFPEQDMSYTRTNALSLRRWPFSLLQPSPPNLLTSQLLMSPTRTLMCNMHANDIKLIDVLIKDDVDSFLTRLFQLLPSSC
jgi:hypothetical protein